MKNLLTRTRQTLYSTAMKVNIYTKNNGVGLQQDALLLKEILKGHSVNIIDWERPQGLTTANIGIHLEHIRREFLHLAPKNIAIPNPEWFEPTFKPFLRNMNAVLCKTNHCLDIFNKLHKNCIYCGWTSRDCYLPDINKRMMFAHLSGRSSHKGSEFVRDVWANDSTMPLLYFQKYIDAHKFIFKNPNVIKQNKRVDDIRTIINMSMFHICCSKAEGFGHYITEALSAGAIIITTDAPPMNEIITSDFGFLVPAKVCGKHRLSNEYCVDVKALKETILKAFNTDPDELMAMSELARETYLQRDKEFRKNIVKIIENV